MTLATCYKCCPVAGGNVRHLEKLVCAETDEECLGQLCPVTMTYDRLQDRCLADVALMGVVGNIKLMCREGFVWVEWKSLCLRQT